MTRYLAIIFTYILGAFAFAPNTAHASYWIECQVTARIAKPDHGNIYVIHIQSAHITGGQGGSRQQNKPCMPNNIGKTLRVPIENMPAHIRQQQIIQLKYHLSHHKSYGGGNKTETWSYIQQAPNPSPPPVMPRPAPPPYNEPPYGDVRMCPEDAKLCPDGSAVGRTGPNCEFAPCP